MIKKFVLTLCVFLAVISQTSLGDIQYFVYLKNGQKNPFYYEGYDAIGTWNIHAVTNGRPTEYPLSVGGQDSFDATVNADASNSLGLYYLNPAVDGADCSDPSTRSSQCYGCKIVFSCIGAGAYVCQTLKATGEKVGSWSGKCTSGGQTTIQVTNTNVITFNMGS